jgi:hypothetical protein
VVDTGWSDFVFDPSYSLRPLDRVEAFIGEHRRLPDIPSAADVVEHGVSVGEMDARLLQKIESSPSTCSTCTNGCARWSARTQA